MASNIATDAAPYFHVGIVVPDLDAACRRLGDLLGVTWGSVLDVEPYGVRDGDGTDLSVRMRLCYSLQAPHLELIEEIPGTTWSCNEHSNLHHIGRWSPDFAVESDRFASAGCPLITCGREGARAPASFAYVGTDLGVRIELLDETIRPAMEAVLFQPRPPGS